MNNYYQILEIQQNASAEEIRIAHKRLVNVFHPDRAVNELQKDYFTEKLKDINEAFSCLKDPNKRAKHDRELQNIKRSLVVEVSPSILSFGIMNTGEQAINTFIVNFSGDPKTIDFSFHPQSIFSAGNIGSVFPDKTFPIEVEVIANTKSLPPGSSIKGQVMVKIDEFEANIDLILKTSLEKHRATIPKPKDTVVPLSFWFRSGDVVYSPEELVPFCDQYWDEAKDYLYDSKQFKKWFVDLRRNDMVGKLETCTKEHNRDIGLEKFLQSIKPNLGKPFIEVKAYNTRLENYNFQARDSSIPRIEIRNKGRGCCYGGAEIKARWLGINHKDFAIPPGKTHTLEFYTNSNEFVWEPTQSAMVEIFTNSHNSPKQSFDFLVSAVKYPPVAEIETLRDKGKWRLAFEKLNDIDTQHANAEKLKQSIQENKATIRRTLLIGAALMYGIIGGAIRTGSDSSLGGFVDGVFTGTILGSIAALVYFEKWGGKYGKDADYAIGGLVMAIVASGIVIVANFPLITLIILIIWYRIKNK